MFSHLYNTPLYFSCQILFNLDKQMIIFIENTFYKTKKKPPNNIYSFTIKLWTLRYSSFQQISAAILQVLQLIIFIAIHYINPLNENFTVYQLLASIICY